MVSEPQARSPRRPLRVLRASCPLGPSRDVSTPVAVVAPTTPRARCSSAAQLAALRPPRAAPTPQRGWWPRPARRCSRRTLPAASRADAAARPVTPRAAGLHTPHARARLSRCARRPAAGSLSLGRLKQGKGNEKSEEDLGFQSLLYEIFLS